METRIIAYLAILLPALVVMLLMANRMTHPGSEARGILYFLVAIIGAACALLMLVF